MQDILIMLGLSFFLACGVCLTAAACVTGESVVPLISVLLGFMALITSCAFNLLQNDNDMDMPSALMDADSEAVTRMDLGWFLCGIFIIAAWCFPLIVARHSILTMRVSWFCSLGTWSLVSTLGLFIIFLHKGRQQHAWDT